jgi:hypothetical protein
MRDEYRDELRELQDELVQIRWRLIGGRFTKAELDEMAVREAQINKRALEIAEELGLPATCSQH